MKNLILFLNVILLAFMFSCSEDVTEKTEIIDSEKGDMPVSEEFNQAYPEGYVMEFEDELIAQKENFGLKSTVPDKSVTLASKATIPVPHKYQETSYWCGPASAQMIQYYFNMPASQSYIAQRCGTKKNGGTYVYKLVNWFNDSPMTGYKKLPSWWKWTAVTLKSYSDFKTKVQKSVGKYKAPQIWHLKTRPSGTYKLPGYTFNSGHYVVGSGYNYSGSTPYVLYDDPWYGSGGGSNKWIRAWIAYNCIYAHARLIIW